MDYLARACTYGRSPRRTRSSSTEARGTPCSRNWRGHPGQEVVFTLFHVAVRVEETAPAPDAGSRRRAPLRARDVRRCGRDRGRRERRDGGRHLRRPSGLSVQEQAVNEHKNIGRNDPWCGSKKYKRCHGAWGRDQLPTRSSTGIREMSRTAILVSLLVATSAAFALLALGYDDDPLGPLDRDVAEWVASDLRGRVEWLARPFSWLGMDQLTALGRGGAARPSARGSTSPSSSSRSSGRSCRRLLKDWFDRPRPDVGPAVPLPESAAFPSGTRPRGWRASALSPSSPRSGCQAGGAHVAVVGGGGHRS